LSEIFSSRKIFVKNAKFGLKPPILEKFKGNITSLITHNILCWKFEAVSRKIATSCLSYFYNPRRRRTLVPCMDSSNFVSGLPDCLLLFKPSDLFFVIFHHLLFASFLLNTRALANNLRRHSNSNARVTSNRF